LSAVRLALRRAADRREPATVLALLRIAFGLCLLWTLWLPVHAEMVDALWSSPAAGGLLPTAREHWLLWLLPEDQSSALWLLLSASAAGAVACTVGFGGRWLLLLTQQLFVALTSLNPELQGGYDTLLAVGLLLLACSACSRTLSVDCWLAHRRFTHDARYPAWPRYALIIQLVCMYTLTGLQKLGWAWTPLGGYSALYYVLSDPTWIRSDWGDMRALSVPLAAATALTWHWEQLAPVLLLHYYFRATPERSGRVRQWFARYDIRRPFVVVGVLLHFGIFVLLDVGPFSLVALTYYLSLCSPAELRAALK
jgi:Vitamin K-dependent gamma-carboxylase